VHQDRPHHGLDLSTLDGAVLIPKSDCQNNTSRDETRRPATRRCIACWLPNGEQGAVRQAAYGPRSLRRDHAPIALSFRQPLVVGAFYNVGAPQKVTAAADGIDAI
jgi:hypothetical protein